MSTAQRAFALYVIVLLFALLVAATSAQAALISLNRTPEPPLCVANNGLEAESYNYTITFSTIANYYTDVVRDPTSTIVRGIFYDCQGTNAGLVPPGFTYVNLGPSVPSPISRSQTYNPGVGAPTGRYEIEITFFSIQGGSAFEAKAAVTFYVCSAKGTLTITKFNDLNSNGIKDPGEPGIQNWLVNILTPIGDTVGRLTNASGVITLSGVGIGSYTVTEVVQSGWKPTTPTSFTVTVTNGGTTNVTFGNVRPVSISGGAFDDTNCSGTLDPGDPLLGGSTFTLTDLSGAPVLDMFGVLVAPQPGPTYNFINLVPASYRVTETNPPLFQSTNAIPGTGGTKLTNDQIRVDATTPGSAYPANNFLDCTPAPGISITKSPSPANAYNGTTITYTFVVTNTGNTPLAVSVSDTVMGNITAHFTAANGGSNAMAAGAVVTFTAPYTVLPGDPDPLANTVTATGTDPFSTVVTGNGNASVPVLRPCINITKTPAPLSGREGDLITYTFVVSNPLYPPCGNRALTSVTVNDTFFGDITADFVAANAGSDTLALAASITFTKTHTLGPGDPNTLTNTVTVHGLDPLLKDYSDTATASVQVLRPCIDVTKTASAISANIGETVTYTYRVRNCGNVALTSVTVVDDTLGDLTADFIAANGGTDTLAIGGDVTFTETFAVASDQPNPIVNTVTATGTDPILLTVTDTATATVWIPVTVSGGKFYYINGNGVLEIGDPPVSATFTIKTLSGQNVQNIFGQCVCPQTGSTFASINLKPGSYIVYETNPPLYTSTNALPGPGGTKINNDAIKVDATPHLVYPNNWFLDTRLGTGSISGKKIDDDTGLGVPDVTVTLRDSGGQVVGITTTNADGDYLFDRLPAGTYKLTETDPIGYESVKAIAGPCGTVLSANNIRVVLPNGGNCPDNDFYDKRAGACIGIQKSVTPTTAKVGDVLTYTFKVTNCGLFPLSGVTVVDDVLGDLTPHFIAANNGNSTLGVGVTVTFTVKYTLPDTAPSPLVNTVTATGTPPFGIPVSDTDSATVNIIHPCIKITKIADPSQVSGPGETVHYHYTVENCGDVPLTGVTVTDDVLGDLTPQFIAANGGSDTLAVLSAVTFTVDVVIPVGATFPIVNTVTASGKDPSGGTSTSTDTAVVTRNGPCAEVTVTAEPGTDAAAQIDAQTVVFKVKVCNCGNAPLTDIKLTGAPCTGSAAPSDIFGDLTPAFEAVNCCGDKLPVGCCVEFTLVHTLRSTDQNPLCLKVTLDANSGGVAVAAESQASIVIGPPRNRQCYLPTTFTRDGWSLNCDMTVYPSFRRAFSGAVYYGLPAPYRLMVGYRLTITFDAASSALKRLCLYLPTMGQCGKLRQSYLNPWTVTEAGILGSESVALMLNIAYNDMRLMPRTPGYDLENFIINQGLLKGRRVREALDMANRIMGGAPPCMFGLPSCDALVQILQSTNANYEWVNYDTFIDRGYLTPNRPFGPPDPPHPPVVP